MRLHSSSTLQQTSMDGRGCLGKARGPKTVHKITKVFDGKEIKNEEIKFLYTMALNYFTQSSKIAKIIFHIHSKIISLFTAASYLNLFHLPSLTQISQ